jgi:hypothetical protein
MSFDDELDAASEVLLSASGNPLSGSSTAAVFSDTLLVGGIHDRGILVCPGRGTL